MNIMELDDEPIGTAAKPSKKCKKALSFVF